jgi:hypothetical protein
MELKKRMVRREVEDMEVDREAQLRIQIMEGRMDKMEAVPKDQVVSNLSQSPSKKKIMLPK